MLTLFLYSARPLPRPVSSFGSIQTGVAMLALAASVSRLTTFFQSEVSVEPGQ